MKIIDFRSEFRKSIQQICKDNSWNEDNEKHRGMAFQNWCYELLCDQFPSADNDIGVSIIRGDDFRIDVNFPNRMHGEVYLLQCKHVNIASNDPIPEDDVLTLFETYRLSFLRS